MATVDVCNKGGETLRQMEVSDGVFAVPVRVDILHQVVTMQLAKKRRGTACVKNRSDVAFSGKKLYRQKGTGRARMGDRRNPLLKGGGTIFGPHPRSYEFKVPKKVRRLALKMALSAKFAEGELKVVDDLGMERIKTRDVAGVLSALDVKNACIVTGSRDENLELSARNLKKVTVLRAEGLNVYDILKHEHLILDEAAVKGVEGRLSA